MKKRNISRRKFLRDSSLMAVGTFFMPLFLKGLDRPNKDLKDKGKKLVIIQLSGGNDGLNTIIPFGDDLYYSNRPKISIPKNEVLQLTDHMGLNPALAPLRSLYDNGDWSIINSVGYPNPNRSHFRSADIWETASASNEYLSTGWLGRYLDQLQEDDFLAHYALNLDNSLRLALKGSERNGFALKDPQKLQRALKNPILDAIVHDHHDHEHQEDVAYLYKTLSNTAASADYLTEMTVSSKASTDYPKHNFGKDLRQIATLMIEGCDTQIYYLTLGGFDTHAGQQNKQQQLLKAYAEGVSSFVSDLKKHDLWKDTTIFTFSEFGRRVAENGSLGTDHGAANNSFVMSGSLKKSGFYNDIPNLEDLNQGDLKYTVDFRSIYSTLLDKWLKVDSQSLLSQSFKNLDLF